MTISRFFGTGGNDDLVFVNVNLLGFAGLGILLTVLVWWDRCSVALLWGAASAAAGFIVGFIFGFPRTVAQPVVSSTPAENNPGAPSARGNGLNQPASTARLSVNTNLEQVSDWITKTIVALGLVQLQQLPRRFARVAAYAANTTGRPYTGGSAQEAAAALIGYFLILGFLAGYLLTRLFFQSAFVKGDQALEAAADILKFAPAGAIGSQEAATPVTGQVSAAAEKLKDLSPSAASAYGISTATIARANLVSGDSKQAVENYRAAIMHDPQDPRLRFEFARALENAGVSGDEVMTALRDARAIESRKQDPDLRRKIYESLTYVALYQPEPDGFTQGILYGSAYAKEPGNLPSAPVWVNLAACYGQKARWTKNHDGQVDATVRTLALEAIREAIRLDPSNRAFLASLLRGDRSGEDDLAIFKDDEEFRRLLDLDPSSRQGS